MLKIGANVACLANYQFEDAINEIYKLNFPALGLLAFDGGVHSIGKLPGFWFDRLNRSERLNLRNLTQKFDTILIHAPFTDVPLFTYNVGIREEAIRQTISSIEAGAFLKATVITMHINTMSIEYFNEIRSYIIETFLYLGDYAEYHNLKLGIETGFPNDIENYINLIKEINHPAVGATVDTGHIFNYVPLSYRKTDEGKTLLNRYLIEIITKLRNKVFHLHVHDVRASDWRDHRSVGSGIIEFPRVIDELTNIGYEGSFELELEEIAQEKALIESKNYLDELILKKKGYNT